VGPGPSSCDNGPVKLAKHHGLGNDFLICDPEGFTPSAEDRVAWSRAWSDRRRGFGADGVMFLLGASAPADLTMILHNADGSRAELSGNGIRCFAHAALRWQGRDEGTVSIASDAGLKIVRVTADANDPTLVSAEVGMGHVDVGPDLPASLVGVGSWRGTASIGNPHLVVEVEPGDLEITDVGPRWESEFAAGINVHLAHLEQLDGGTSSRLRIHTWERGAGLTEACGTGATVAAEVFRRRGLVDSTVEVAMVGGSVEVRSEADGEQVLVGPSQLIGDLTPALAMMHS